MHIWIVEALGRVVLLTGESDQAVVIEEYCHGRNDRCDQNINPKIILVTLVQCWLLDVFLNDVLILWSFHPPLHNIVDCILGLGVGVLHGGVDPLLDLNIFVELLSVPFVCFVKLDAHILHFRCYENASALGPGLRLANIENNRIQFRLSFCHFAIVNQFFSLVCLLFGVFLYVVKLSGVHPSLREKIVMVRKFLLEALEMNTQ